MRKCTITMEERKQHIECLFRTYASRYAYEKALTYILGSLKRSYITVRMYNELKSIALAEYRRRQTGMKEMFDVERQRIKRFAVDVLCGVDCTTDNHHHVYEHCFFDTYEEAEAFSSLFPEGKATKVIDLANLPF